MAVGGAVPVISAAFVIATILTAAFHGPTWAWAVLLGLAVASLLAELDG